MKGYDVDAYTDQEIYQILGLSDNPGDRELEVAILSQVNKYSTIHSAGGAKLLDFFTNIYRRFFELDEELQNSYITTNIEGFTPGPAPAPASSSKKKEVDVNDYQAVLEEEDEDVGRPAKDKKGKKEDDEVKQIQVSNAVFKDKLNPILTQTIKRTLVVDSQYRDSISPSSTNFTFNLSEPLKDVLSMKLYSVQIPYSWYTVNNQFGGNFFLIRGNSPGIDNGNHDYRINILSGNYSPDTVVSAINTGIQTLATLPQYADMDFGTTGISYNSPTCLSTMIVDLKKTYNETNYYLYFPEWTSPLDAIQRRNTLAGYMGFNYTEYDCSTIYSARDLPLINNSPISGDNINSIYVLDASNCEFNVHCYDGVKYASYDVSGVIQTYKITLPLGTYTRNALTTAVNTALENAGVFDLSYTLLQRIDITDSLKQDNEFSYYSFGVKLDRLKGPRDIGSKLAIEFPDETYKPPLGQTAVWTGSDSCFHFTALIEEANIITSETNMLQTNYVIPTGNDIRIELICLLEPYNTEFNSYIIDIPTSATTGYLLTDLIANINVAIQLANTTYSLSDGKDDLSYPKTQFLVDPYTNLLDLSVDLTRVFRNDFYHALINHQYLGDWDTDLSGSVSTFTKVFPLFSVYALFPEDSIIITPILSTGFVSTTEGATFTIGVSSPVYYNNYQDLQKGINNLFINFVDDNGDRPLQNTRVSMEIYNQLYVLATLRIVVAKSLGQLDYKVRFVDDTAETAEQSLWASKLYFMEEYILADAPLNGSISTITNTQIISDNQILVTRGVNDSFYILPYDDIDGLNPGTRDYDIQIRIPQGTYSRNTLFSQINTLFASNPICANTRISAYSNNGKEYTRFNVFINKTFTTKDYKLTFYDSLAFSTCLSRGSTKSIQSVTWDTTIGWLLGYRAIPEYILSDYVDEFDTVSPTRLDAVLNYYNSANTNACVLRGDTGVSVNLFNYFLIVLDDYTQNHLNDGLVTTTLPQTSVAIPGEVTYVCNPITGKPVMSLVPTAGKSGNTMTAAQIYANQQKILSQMAVAKSNSTGPFATDVFALIPMKLTGLQPGQVFVETSGTLQNQDRVYFGPVNLNRMTIKLLSDRGNLVDLNNTNWSFSIVVEMLYKQ